MNITLLYGGSSSEREISIRTSIAIAEVISGLYNLDMIDLSSKFYENPHDLYKSDLVFNALHGGDGENGTLQSFLDLHHIPYTGSDAKSSRIAMDKNIAKLIAQSINIKTPKWFMINLNDKENIKLLDHNSEKFSYPIIIKPANEGSTYGLSIVRKESELNDAINLSSMFSSQILVEEYIEGRELTVGILGDKPLPVLEIKTSGDLYDYKCKYTEGMSEYVVPAKIDNSIERIVSENALKIFQEIGCRHYSRVDFRLNEKGECYLLEINTLPGMTSTSLLPKAAKAAGLDFKQLIEFIINQAIMDKNEIL